MQSKLSTLAIFLSALLMASMAAARDKPVELGVQASLADSGLNFGIGARLVTDFPALADRVRFIGTFDYFFPDGGRHYWELNGNLVYAFHVRRSKVEPYAGAGLALGHSPGDSAFGLNLVGGLNFRGSSLKPFVEAKVEVRDGGPFVVAAGFRF
jgi:hypothetical protein